MRSLLEYIATFGETTAHRTLESMRKKMSDHPEGRRILRYVDVVLSGPLGSLIKGAALVETPLETWVCCRDRPLVNSKTVNFSEFPKLPMGTFGAAYMAFLQANVGCGLRRLSQIGVSLLVLRQGVSPDSRKRVHFVDDEELAYVMQRYREVHDLVHTLLGMKTNLLGEITVKWIEALQFGLPMCVAAGVFGPWRLKPM